MCSAWARSAAAIESSSMFMWNTSAISWTCGESISRRSSFGVVERPEQVGLVAVERLEGDDDPVGIASSIAPPMVCAARSSSASRPSGPAGYETSERGRASGAERVRLLEAEAQVVARPGV